MGNNTSKSPTGRNDVPPPLPPKPLKYQPEFTTISDKIYDVLNNDSVVMSDPKLIGDLVKEFSHHLPLCFSVSESMYGICGDRSLMETQLLSAHFMKTMKVVDVKVKQHGNEYTLPVCSSLLVSVLYNPEIKPERAKKGYIFNEMADIINANPMPKCVCVCDSFKDSENNLIKKNDILVIEKKVKHQGLDCILCTNIRTGKAFKINQNCSGKFHTAVDSITMSLNELIKRFDLPVDVVFKSPKDGSIVLPLSAMERVYTLCKVREEESLIVSTKYTSEDCSNSDSLQETIEIFLSVPLEVQLVKLEPKDLESLRLETKGLYDIFQPSNVSKVICDIDSSINFVQTELYRAIRRDIWNDGVSIIKPLPPAVDDDSSAVDDSDDYMDMEPHLSLPIISSSPRVPTKPFQSKSNTIPRRQGDFREGGRESPDSRHKGNDDISPYLIVRRQNDGNEDILTHEIPPEYVKLSIAKKSQMEALKDMLSQVTPSPNNSHVPPESPVMNSK